MDFWTVKNVTGRLMVGLRWWNFIDEDGNSHWVFENRHAKSEGDKSLADPRPTSSDSALFWAALTVAPLLWFFLLLVALFRLNVQYFVRPPPVVSLLSRPLADDRGSRTHPQFFQPVRLHPLSRRICGLEVRRHTVRRQANRL